MLGLGKDKVDISFNLGNNNEKFSKKIRKIIKVTEV